MGENKKTIQLSEKKSYSGIPEAKFVEDVDTFMNLPENHGKVEDVLKRLDNEHRKYKLVEVDLVTKKRRLQLQIPELKRTLNVIARLEIEKNEFEATFLLNDQLFGKAKVVPTDSVCLWLGANVMLEFPLEDAKKILTDNMVSAEDKLTCVEHDLDFLRDQFTTTQVNMARLYNWNVKKRSEAQKKDTN